ncbi:MAG: T9SS type A sorting domain-containing protein [Chitinophagaceae bacterium]|jgi:hypothetical protein
MKKLLCAFAVCIGFNAMAQTKPLPYFTGFEELPATDWQVIRKGAASPYYLWKIDSGTPYAGKLSLYHGYPVGGTTVTDDWFVSPAFSLSSGGNIDSIRHNFSGFGTPATGDTVGLYLLSGNPDPALASSVTLLYDFRNTKYTADHAWYKVSNVPIPPVTGNAYIGIRYHTVSNWLDVRFDNLSISSKKPSSIRNVYKQGTDFTVSPVPVMHSLHINSTVPFKWIELYDAMGRRILQQAFEPSIDLSTITSGQYVLVLSDEQQQKGILTITKQ